MYYIICKCTYNLHINVSKFIQPTIFTYKEQKLKKIKNYLKRKFEFYEYFSYITT